MINVAFFGNQELNNRIKESLKQYVQSVISTKADVFLISIETLNDFNGIPKQFDKPSLLYLKSNDQKIINLIKNYSFSGILPASANNDVLLKKLISIKDAELGKTINETEVLRAKILAKAENIPPLPLVAQELLKLTRSDETSLKKIIDKIKTDQGISSKVLKLINSPFYALRKEITSIDQASMLLGTNSIKNLILSVSIEDFYHKNFSLYGTNGTKLWEHAYNTALITEFIGKKCKMDTDACYLAGLMHDIGKIVLVDFLLKEVQSSEDEKNQVGLTHEEVSAIILEKWGLSKSIIKAVRDHHTKTEDTFSTILYYSNLLDKNRYESDSFIDEIKLQLKIDISELTNILKKAEDVDTAQ
ncbi:MAG: HDOD domain-containing protein [Calditerrivibrio sp.]|nr:HDOD domain-containing protein [Calditerrivibrio sp.]